MTGQKKVYSDFISKKGRKAIFLNHEVTVQYPSSPFFFFLKSIAMLNSCVGCFFQVYKSTAQTLLPYAISELKKGGYKMVSLSTCLGKPAYVSTTKAGTRDVRILGRTYSFNVKVPIP